MRVAFLTAEFPIQKNTGGGVGNYVLKMALALKSKGHDPEVFIISSSEGRVNYKGLWVTRVPRPQGFFLRAAQRVSRSVFKSRLLSDYLAARGLAKALEVRHQEKPFQIVQSSNYRLTGLCVTPRSGRQHLIRLSTSRMLFDKADGKKTGWPQRAVEYFDVRTMRRADAVYAPSRYLASYFNRRYGLDVRVVRPPYELRFDPVENLPFELPPRYLIHFGRLGQRKGTDVLAAALAIAWQKEPTLNMVWVGALHDDQWQRYRAMWNDQPAGVLWLGPTPSDQLYAVLRRAEAAVLPSRVDNLPNTVIESLALGVPVIGSRGASINELVEEGKSGALVPIGDADSLAEALVRCWRREFPWLGSGFRRPAIFEEMRTNTAVANLLRISGTPSDTP